MKIKRFLSTLFAIIMTFTLFTVFVDVDVLASGEKIKEIGEVENLFYGYNVTGGKQLCEEGALNLSFELIDPAKEEDYKQHIRKVNNVATQTSKSVVGNSMREVISQYNNSFELNMFGKIYMVDISADTAFDTSRRKANAYTEQYELYRTIITRHSYIVALDTYEIREYLNPKFLAEINAVDSVKAAERLFSRYGTHLNTGYTYGGIMHITNLKSTTSKTQSLEKALSIKQAIDFATHGGEESVLLNEIANQETVGETSSTYDFVSYGGAPTSSVSLDHLFKYDPSLLYGQEKAGYEYTKWIKSIEHGEKLTITGIPSNAQSIPLWNLLENTTENSVIRQYLIDAYVNICGDKYNEFNQKYKEFERPLATLPNESDGIMPTINGMSLRTPENLFYYIPSIDFSSSDGDHYGVNYNDCLYLDLYYPGSIEDIDFECSGCVCVDKKNGVFKVISKNGSAIIKAKYLRDGKPAEGILLNVPIRSKAFSGGFGNQKYPYAISNKSELLNVAKDLSASYILMNDIDLGGDKISSFGDFYGNFNGNYCTISNFTINSSTNWGLFSRNEGTIKNLNIENAGTSNNYGDFAHGGTGDIIDNCGTDGFKINSVQAVNAGLLCGINENKGVIENCYVNNSYIRNVLQNEKGLLSNKSLTVAVGGLAGKNLGSISNSMAKNINIVNSICYNDSAKKDYSINNYSGVLVGFNSGSIIGSVALESGAMNVMTSIINQTPMIDTNTSVNNCYIGGIAGFVSGGTIKNTSALIGKMTFRPHIRNDKQGSGFHGLRTASFVCDGIPTVEKTYASADSDLNNVAIPFSAIKPSKISGGNSTGKNDCYESLNYVNETKLMNDRSEQNYDILGLINPYFEFDKSNLIIHILDKARNEILNIQYESKNNIKSDYNAGELVSLNGLQLGTYLVGNGITSSDEKIENKYYYVSFIDKVSGTNLDLTVDKMTKLGSKYELRFGLNNLLDPNITDDVVTNTATHLNVEKEVIEKIFIKNSLDNPDDIIYKDEASAYAESFNFDRIDIYALLTNGMEVLLDKDSPYLGMYELKVDKNKIEKGFNFKEITLISKNKEYKCEFILKCEERQISSVEISKLPRKLDYKYGDKFNAEGMEVTVRYVDGHVYIINDTNMNEVEFVGDRISRGRNKVGVVYSDYKNIQYVEVEGGIPTYTITFKNADGTIISETTYSDGEAVLAPENPTLASDEVYKYKFEKWDSEITPARKNKTYTAQYIKTFINYTVTFKNYDGQIILIKSDYHYGDTVTAPESPTRAADLENRYIFSGWDREIEIVTGNVEYTAQYIPEKIKYKVEFKDYDGRIISTNSEYFYGDPITLPENPSRLADKTYTYVFKGWDKPTETCTGNMVFTAQYEEKYIDYTIQFINYDGSVVNSRIYHYGDKIIEPSRPTKPSDDVYSYEFAGWDKAFDTVLDNASFIATYTKAYVEYTVKFVNYDGTLISSNTYHYGDAVEAPKNPIRAADKTYTYVFKGWDKEIIAVAGNVTYTATYTGTYIEYTITFKNYDNTVLSTKIYHYGDAVVEPEAPTKAGDNAYKYEFAGWNNQVVAVEGNAEYIAIFKKVGIEYTIIFKNYDDSVIATKVYHYGEEVVAPENPTRAADNTYTYIFKSWDKEIVVATADATYKATYTKSYIDYTVEFKDYDGRVLSTKTYHYGDTITAPEAPTRAADNTYTYVFKDWDTEVVAVKGNMVYTAVYTATYIDYIIKFVNYNDQVLLTKPYHYGDTVTVPENPTKEANNTYRYEFTGWDNEIVPVSGNATYKAIFTEVLRDYIVKFVDYDGSLISNTSYHYGDTVTAPETPTRAADNIYTYVFKAWDKKIVEVAGNVIYTATYTATYINYTIIFKNYDGTVLSTKLYHYDEPVVAPEVPTRSSDEAYDYEFAGWDSEIIAVNGDKIYTATYTSTYINYTITFKNYDGTVLKTDKYKYGDIVIAPEAPTKPADNTYKYEFNGWDKEVVNVSASATYTAEYRSIYIDYTVEFKNYDGTILSTKKYHYGDTVIAPEAPTKPADNTYKYEFKSWDSEVVAVVEDTSYTAIYAKIYIEYTITFKNYDGKVLSTNKYHYGDAVTAPKNPTRASDNTYKYEFESWNNEIIAVVGDATYEAVFKKIYIEYTIIFKDYDGTLISSKTYHYGEKPVVPENPVRIPEDNYEYKFASWGEPVANVSGNYTYIASYTRVIREYTIVFKDYDGRVISEGKYHYGDTITEPAHPTREADNIYKYEFKGWSSEIGKVASNMIFVAEYNETNIKYTIIFKNWDGIIIETQTYNYGDLIVAPLHPTRPSTEDCTYEFIGWDKELSKVTMDLVVYAQFAEKAIPTFTINFVNYDGNIIQSFQCKAGETVIMPIEPTRPSDKKYTYKFIGWDKPIEPVTGNATYTAVYESIKNVNSYKVATIVTGSVLGALVLIGIIILIIKIFF